MKRWVTGLVFACGAIAAASCNSSTCGPGTKQVQTKDGTLQCVPVDGQPSSIPCDRDGGASIVGGHCVATLKCGPNTMLDPTSNECVGAGMSSGCPHPDSQHICIYGTVHDFLDDAAVVAKVHVALYNPATLLSVGPSTEPIAEADFNNGVFVFPSLPFSSIGQLGRVAVAVGDKTNTTSILCATGNQGLVAGETYRIDGYLLQTNTVAAWKPTIDVLQTGAYVAKFYADAKPGNINLAIFETLRQPGVQLLREGQPDANVHYFGLTLGSINPNLTSTSAAGAAITLPPAGGQSANFSGMGGGVNTWEVQPGGSAAGVVFVARFHPNL